MATSSQISSSSSSYLVSSLATSSTTSLQEQNLKLTKQVKEYFQQMEEMQNKIKLLNGRIEFYKIETATLHEDVAHMRSQQKELRQVLHQSAATQKKLEGQINSMINSLDEFIKEPVDEKMATLIRSYEDGERGRRINAELAAQKALEAQRKAETKLAFANEQIRTLLQENSQLIEERIKSPTRRQVTVVESSVSSSSVTISTSTKGMPVHKRTTGCRSLPHPPSLSSSTVKSSTSK